jgi:CheY-like chemotaxis protein
MNQTLERTRVLLVEADAERRALLGGALEQAGFAAATAEAGERALMILRQWPRRVEWLVAGSGLPGLVDGWMLAEEFHQTHPGRPVLLSSDEVQRSSQPHAIAVDFASPADVAGTLRSLVSGMASPAQAITAWAA